MENLDAMNTHEMIQMTIYKDPFDSIKCQYGRVSVREWLEKEVARRKKNRPDRMVEVRESPLNGKIALFVE